ncbi:MAG: hypothetical protein RI956_180, partial [Pseudomonadota bacterium]
TIEGEELTIKGEISHKKQQNDLVKRLTKLVGSTQNDDSDNNSVGSLENTTGRHNIEPTLPLVSHKKMIKYGHSVFLDSIGNKVIPKIPNKESGYGVCWAASMAMMGPINTSTSVPSYANWIYDNPNQSVSFKNNLTPSRKRAIELFKQKNPTAKSFILDKRRMYSSEEYSEEMQSMLRAYENCDGRSGYTLAVTQGLAPVPFAITAKQELNPMLKYEQRLTPKILNTLLSKDNTGILASYHTINTKMIKDGDTPSGAHAVVLTGVKNNKIIYNDSNFKNRQEVTFKQLNAALTKNSYALIAKDKAVILPSVDIDSTNKYVGKINLKKSSNEEILQYMNKSSVKYRKDIMLKSLNPIKASPATVQDAADFMKFLAQVDDVVKLRYNEAIEKRLITVRSVLPNITVLPLPASFHDIKIQNNKNLRILQKKLNELQVPYKNLLRANDIKRNG